MKIIISRKGFDGSAGGCASPIFPDGRMVSLPIPGAGAPIRYRDIESHAGNLGYVAQSLSKAAVRSHSIAHLDPDLSAMCLPRPEGWRASLGQTGAAQSHLAGQGVGPGDLFLFFGWFRQAEPSESGAWRFVPGARDIQALFGYLQIGEAIHFGAKPDRQAILAERPWLEGHPHLRGARADNNTVYAAADKLSLPGLDCQGLPGAGIFENVRPELILTADDAPSRSVWNAPSWMAPTPSRSLSYHSDPARWSTAADGSTRLKAVAKGQEFVFDADGLPEALAWAFGIAQLSIAPAPPAPSSPMRRRRP